MGKTSNKEYKVTCTLTDRSTGITKNVDDLTEAERRKAAVIMGMRMLKQHYGPNCVITLTDPGAEERYGIRSM
ncbi:MAG: hypothetical protein J1F63_00255 [Oscillospiraceae bacterium]|nr:hypothetical protein [Oscillospiraceae bacterium]